MPAARPEPFKTEELLAGVIAGLIGDVRHVAVGNASPIPAAAALLARERGGGRPYVSLLQSRKHNFFTAGGCELFDCAGQGRIDVFFLSGGQIGGDGSINLVSIGAHDHPSVRFPGSFGSGYLYYVVPKVILFRTGAFAAHLGAEGRFRQRAGNEPGQCLPDRRADRAGDQSLRVLLRQGEKAIPARQRASGAHTGRSARRDRIRIRHAGARSAKRPRRTPTPCA